MNQALTTERLNKLNPKPIKDIATKLHKTFISEIRNGSIKIFVLSKIKRPVTKITMPAKNSFLKALYA